MRRGRRKPTTSCWKLRWLRGGDLNPRPLGYEPNELPDCSTPRHGTSARVERTVAVVRVNRTPQCSTRTAERKGPGVSYAGSAPTGTSSEMCNPGATLAYAQ